MSVISDAMRLALREKRKARKAEEKKAKRAAAKKARTNKALVKTALRKPLSAPRREETALAPASSKPKPFVNNGKRLPSATQALA